MASSTTFFTLLLYTITVFLLDQGAGKNRSACPTEFSCGSLGTMKYPFSSNISGDECGLLKLECDAVPLPRIRVGRKYYYVYGKLGDYIRLYDPELEQIVLNRPRCNSFDTNVSFPNSPWVSFVIPHNFTLFICQNTPNLTQQMNHFGYSNHTKCRGFSLFYRPPGEGDPLPNLPNHHGFPAFPPKCSPILLPFEKAYSTIDLFDIISVTFVLEWLLSEDCSNCQKRGGQCVTTADNQFHCSKERGKSIMSRVILVTVASVVGVTMLMTMLLCLWRNFLYQIFMNFLKTEDERNIEVFLRNNGSFSPKRYTYLEVKRITNSFRNKLGQGGFGFLYKGKLDNGAFVAVKLLKEIKGSGEEFINEVASISRTSHVNIVTLLGFCVDGDKRALLYEFMPNGSLESFIYDRKLKRDRQLEWLALYKITIGIARGLEYLHRGCRTKILHFDIKPHNILLDEDFCPKISDFGLAKLHTTKESFLSITGARGTIGYVAPEVACRNFGAISHKADVYSYGMMVLEIVSGRKNVEHDVDRNSEIYFPHWIYRQIELDKELGLKGIMNELDKEYARKMIMVGLWCIHVDPSIRPSISMVLEMLESSADLLPFPPKPYLYSSASTEANSSILH